MAPLLPLAGMERSAIRKLAYALMYFNNGRYLVGKSENIEATRIV